MFGTTSGYDAGRVPRSSGAQCREIGTQLDMRHLVQRIFSISTYRHLDRRLAVDAPLRRAVLACGVSLSVVCYVLAMTTG